MTIYTNPLYTPNVSASQAPAAALQLQQLPSSAITIVIPAAAMPALAPANQLLIPINHSRSSCSRCCTIRRVIICQLASIILIIAISVGISYFANDRSFKDWDGVVYVVLSAICLIYIFGCCVVSSCHYIMYGSEQDDD